MPDLRGQMLTQRLMFPPATMLVGDVWHCDFKQTVELLRADSQLVDCVSQPPELIVVCQSRPGTVNKSFIKSLRRTAPLASIIALAGSWCEGETRTGRPLPGVDRIYWHEFPAWWYRQLGLRTAGSCPDWASPMSVRCSELARPRPRPSVIAIRTSVRETVNALSDTLSRAGFTAAWQPGSPSNLTIRGAGAGIWVGGQLNDRETADLQAFCRTLSVERQSVVAMLDFPRRDSVDRAMQVGAAVVFGLPWRNADLVGTLDSLVEPNQVRCAA